MVSNESGCGLSKRGGADLWQVLLFLFLTAVPDKLVDAEVRLVSVAQTHGTADTANLLHHNAVLKIPETSTSILFCE